ncbi:MAG: hypothetical protein IKM99_07865 [Bacteroidales bacterium]|nr:hypothetical protein [Bacteroidales bacterium]
MKKTAIIFCLLAFALTACKPDPEPEPTPGNGGQNNDTTETVVKKYLVKKLFNDDPEQIRLAIDWNEDCTQIFHVRYSPVGSIVDYDFKYYGYDSIRVIPSLPQFSYPVWCFWYDSIMIHLCENRIDSICCYANGELNDVEHYFYNNSGKLIKRSYFKDFTTDSFIWEGDNVIEHNIMGYGAVTIDSFTNYIHPYCNLPFYLSNEVAYEIREPLFEPLWKHQPVQRNCIEYETDEDGYITKMTFYNYDSTQTYSYNYYYITQNQ